VWVVDDKLIIRYLCDSWYSDTGYTKEAVEGKALAYLVHPDDMGTIIEAAEKIRAGETVTVDYRGLFSGGGYRHFTAAVIPLRGADGRVAMGIGLSRDVADEVERRKKLEALEAFRRGLLDNAGVLVIAVDETGNVTAYNRAMEQLTGYPAEAIVGKHIRNLLPRGAAAWVEAAIVNHMRRTDIHDWDLHVQASDGSVHVCRMSPSVIAVGERVTGVLQAGRDVTAEVAREKSEQHVAEVEQELETLRRELENRYQFSNIVARAPKMRQVFETIVAVADSSATVLIQGETGTGKALVARAIHYNSSRRDKPFVEVDCGALTETLLESELFGHVRGAFTGALRDKVGRFELASGGTIFLDEIANLSLPLQVKLLRAVQEGKFERVGGTETIAVNVRIVAATNEDLSTLVEQGRFRKDLYYRLNVIPMYLPALRERKEDIPLLVMHFLRRFAEKNGRDIEGLTREAMDKLVEYPWPGNVRELENLTEQAVVLARGKMIEVDDLRLPRSFSPVLDFQVPIPDEILPLEQIMSEPERTYIVEVLKRLGGNKKKAAATLGLSRTSFYKKLMKYNIRDTEYM